MKQEKEDRAAQREKEAAAATKIQAFVRGQKVRDPYYGAAEVEGFGDVRMAGAEMVPGAESRFGKGEELTGVNWADGSGDVTRKTTIDWAEQDAIEDYEYAEQRGQVGVGQQYGRLAESRETVQGVEQARNALPGGVATIIPSTRKGVIAEDLMIKEGGKFKKVWQERAFFLSWYGMGW